MKPTATYTELNAIIFFQPQEKKGSGSKKAKDCSTGGMLQPGRTFSSADYRFGFSGHEKLDEISGIGNNVDMGARLLDTRLARTPSPDPKAHEYPGISPYAYAMNSFVSAVDRDGKRVYFVGGAGLDTKGWNYTERWGAAFKSNEVKGAFYPLRDVSHDAPGKFPINDVLFTSEFSQSTRASEPSNFNTMGVATGEKLVKLTDKMIDKAVKEVISDLMKNPLPEGEQLNLVGYSYGSVLQAHIALALTEKGYKVDNLVLVGSPISDQSDLFKQLQKVTNVIREDIPGDKLSNSKGGDFVSGGLGVLRQGDNAHHFDLARPGADSDKKIDNAVKDMKDKGVE